MHHDQQSLVNQLKDYLQTKGAFDFVESQEREIGRLTQENDKMQHLLQSGVHNLRSQYDSQLDQITNLKQENASLIIENNELREETNRVLDDLNAANTQIDDLTNLLDMAKKLVKRVQQCT